MEAMENEVLYLLNQGLKVSIMGLVAYFSGLLVKHRQVKVNYTRKINHFVLVFIPPFIDIVLDYGENGFEVVGYVMALAALFVFTRPMREKFPVFDLMFSSFDRPEDRPFTLLWLFTQLLACYVVVGAMAYLYEFYGLPEELILIPVLIGGIGDGLAEPVGVRFGRYRYRSRALFTGREYVRTLEGSAAVFITSIAVVALFHPVFSTTQFIVSLGLVPVAMTLAEAFSPHTWDNPFIFLVGYLVLFGIYFI